MGAYRVGVTLSNQNGDKSQRMSFTVRIVSANTDDTNDEAAVSDENALVEFDASIFAEQLFKRAEDIRLSLLNKSQ